MAITDELRKEAQGDLRYLYTSGQEKHLLAIADRIDAEHAGAQRRWMAELDAARERSFNAGFDDGFASADDWLAQHEDAMREHGWVKLPKDADGEYIHIGDVMEERSGHTFVVAALMALGNNNNWVVLSEPRNFSTFRETYDVRHHKPPTVEDVLTDLCEHVWESALLGTTWSDSPVEPYIAEYAAKLRLANNGKDQ